MKQTDAQAARNPPFHGRWIRPAESDESIDDPFDEVRLESESVDGGAIENVLLGEARRRLVRLARLEREIEDHIRSRWRQAEVEVKESEARSEKERADFDRQARTELREATLRAQKEGRAEGFREGFEKGAEDGRRLGLEQGRLEGTREGRTSGRREEEARLQEEMSHALGALAVATTAFQEKRQPLLEEAQRGVLDLAIEIARKVIQKEIELDTETIIGVVKRAVEQIFRGSDLTLQLHPEDARIVEETLAGNPRWAEDLRQVEVRPSPEIDRGGCRLLSGAGVVDVTVESQLELIGEALNQSLGRAMASCDNSAGEESGIDGGSRP